MLRLLCCKVLKSASVTPPIEAVLRRFAGPTLTQADMAKKANESVKVQYGAKLCEKIHFFHNNLVHCEQNPLSFYIKASYLKHETRQEINSIVILKKIIEIYTRTNNLRRTLHTVLKIVTIPIEI